MPTEWLIVLVVAIVIALPVLLVTISVARRRGQLERESAAANAEAARVLEEERAARKEAAARAAEEAARPAPPPVAVVVNPSKNVDVDELRTLFRAAAVREGRQEPLWFETTADDPGRGQAEEALRAGASTVVAAGGDGTVRAVAEVLAGTGTPMGVIPLGTGNLLARNLGLPLERTDELVRIATTEPTGPVDVGWLRVRDQGEVPQDEDGILVEESGAGRDGWHAFTVIAGLGFDADMVHGTDDDLKSRIGWVAYFVGGVKNMVKSRLKVSVAVDDAEPEHLKIRTVMLANCGLLPGNLVLSPDSRFDDGVLEVVTVDTRFGIVGWANLGISVLAQRAGRRRTGELPGSELLFKPARRVRVVAEDAAHVQLDGDLLSTSGAVEVRVEKGALQMRYPVPPDRLQARTGEHVPGEPAERHPEKLQD
ncbi:diacylglycerol/lipid kinase family protein [Georgenia sp. Z1344]|uniref:diacylglycerol/lipid kinase family protein n=1 Tax=Georgenia sp. Z1344 TaxID=3416706 RepID=UPI003CEAA379